jgi:hypothetical protein
MRRSKRSKHKPAFMFDTAAGSHLPRPYRPAVLVAQAILPDFHDCTEDDSVAKPPVEKHNSAGEEDISGSSAFEFSTAKSADTSTDQCSFDRLVYLINNRDRIVSNDGCSSPLFRLFTRGRKRTQIFHIKSQASNLTSR